MQIFVRSPEGSIVGIELQPDEYISSLKTKIQYKLGKHNCIF